MTFEVAGAAIVRAGRVLAARRVYPADVAGGWELPGGKIDEGETAADAVAREIREELTCDVEVVGSLAGRSPIKPGYELTVHLARLTSGEPVPHEHDAIRWLAPEELGDVAWLPSDRPFLAELEAVLRDGERLVGGNVGGAVRIGPTVRRSIGPWTPAVHALLDHLHDAGLDAVPQVLGVDEQGREVLSHLPGRVLDVDTENASPELLADAMRWLGRLHDITQGFAHPGPWRNDDPASRAGGVVCHHDFAPYNVAISTSAHGDRLAGVFDWDMAGPGERLDDLGFAAWNWVPLVRDVPAADAAERLALMARAYGRGVAAVDVLQAVVPRVERSVRVIAEGQARGDEGMLNLGRVGEPARTAARVDRLRQRIPEIVVHLSR